MQETYAELWRALQLHAPVLPTALAQQFIRARFRDIRRKRLWSWRVAQSQFITPNVYSIGLASATLGSNVITGSGGTNWTQALVGQQFRFGTVAPVYTVVEVDSPTSLLLDQPYGGIASPSPTGYQIFVGYLTPPPDFQDFISVRDTFNNYRLRTHLSQEYLDSIDSQRATSGNAYGIADFRYSTSPTAGSVSPSAVALGSNLDPAPVTFGTYVGRTDSIFIITVTLGGVTGTAQFSWAKDNGQPNAGIVTTATAFPLQEGVNIQWPVGPAGSPLNYVQGDIFVCKVRPGFALTVPQYELWPYGMSQRVYPFMYDKRFPDIDDPNGMIPPFIDADLLVKGALSDVCRWKGTETRANPMYGLDTATSFEKEFQAKVAELEREDDEIYCVDVRYQFEIFSLLEYAPFPFGANWAQSHAVMT